MDLATKTGYIARQYKGDSDLQAMCDLLNLCSDLEDLDDNHSLEDLRLELASPHFDQARDLRLWEDSNKLVGFCEVRLPEQGEVVDGRLYFRVHPEARGSGLESEIISWASDRIREVAQERNQEAKLYGWAREHEAYTRSTLEQNGFGVVRYFFRMGRPLEEPIDEPQFPEGFTLRHSQGGDDVSRWVEMFNQSFIDHWNHHPMTVEGHEHWLTSPKYNPERNLIAIAPDGTFAAFCFCWIDPEDNERHNRKDGWIDILGTRRGFRKMGLGRAMLLAGLHRLKSDGMDKAKLGVDAENPTGALRLYESVGFVNEQTSIAYCKNL